MMVRVLAAVWAVLAAASTSEANTTLSRVVLLPAGERESLVFELTEPPQDVATRRVTASILDIAIGPIAGPAATESFTAPPGVRLVSSVAIQSGAAGSGLQLRARLTLAPGSRSSVRVVGRRVYLDVWPEEHPQPPRRPPAPTPGPAAPPADRAAVAVAASEAYAAAIRPTIARLEEIAPFLLSATSSPTEPVLKAVGDTLAPLAQAVGSIRAPAESREAHDLLASAITVALTAVDPSFAGDRAAQARHALALFDRAKAAL